MLEQPIKADFNEKKGVYTRDLLAEYNSCFGVPRLVHFYQMHNSKTKKYSFRIYFCSIINYSQHRSTRTIVAFPPKPSRNLSDFLSKSHPSLHVHVHVPFPISLSINIKRREGIRKSQHRRIHFVILLRMMLHLCYSRNLP